MDRPASNGRGSIGPQAFLLIGLATFIVALGYLVASSLRRREVASFEPSPVAYVDRFADTLVTDTATVDARAEREWRFFDFDRGSVVLPPDTGGWDVAFRRFSVIVAGSVVNLGRIPFEDVLTAPDTTYIATTWARDTSNAAIDRWYDYSMVTHLLEPADNVYVIQTDEGRYAKLQFLSYYCPGVAAGCPTFRYTYQPSGSRSLSGRR